MLVSIADEPQEEDIASVLDNMVVDRMKELHAISLRALWHVVYVFMLLIENGSDEEAMAIGLLETHFFSSCWMH